MFAITAVSQAAGGGTASVRPGAAAVLIAAIGITGYVISQNPSLVYTDLAAPAGATIRTDIQLISSVGGLQLMPRGVPVSAGEAIYVAFSGKGSVTLYFDEIS